MSSNEPDAAARNQDPELPLGENGARSEEGMFAASGAKLERRAVKRAVGKGQDEKGNRQRFLIRVTSIKRRLLDEDNMCEKFAVDCCRYAGLLNQDSPGTTKIEVAQRKAEKGEEEHTIVQIYRIEE